MFWAALLAVPIAGNLGARLAAGRGDDRRLGAARRLQRPPRRARGGLEVPRADDARAVGRAARDRRARDRAGGRRTLRPARARLARARELAPAALPREATVVAFVLILAGLATKIGWAPVHNWLPDAHSEAPAPISALLSAALLPTVLLVAWRVKMTLDVAVGATRARALFIGFGLASMVVAVPFLWRPLPWKRLLAYSSLEHMGVIALGIGFGTPLAIAGVVLHVAGHALAKALGLLRRAAAAARSIPTPRTRAPAGVHRPEPARPPSAMGVSLVALVGPAALAAVRLRAADPARRHRRGPDGRGGGRRRRARARLPRPAARADRGRDRRAHRPPAPAPAHRSERSIALLTAVLGAGLLALTVAGAAAARLGLRRDASRGARCDRRRSEERVTRRRVARADRRGDRRRRALRRRLGDAARGRHRVAGAARLARRRRACSGAAADGGAVETIVDLVEAADWDEREAHDLHGLRFDGHEPLRALARHPDELGAWTIPVDRRRRAPGRRRARSTPA